MYRILVIIYDHYDPKIIPIFPRMIFNSEGTFGGPTHACVVIRLNEAIVAYRSLRGIVPFTKKKSESSKKNF